MKPSLAIILVNWNTKALLSLCLGQLLYPHCSPSDAEVVVVDNASTDGSQAIVQERFPRVLLVQNERNVGFARANNQGITTCRAEFVLLLNSDAVVHPGAIDAMLEFLLLHPSAAAVGPRLLNGDGSFQPSCHPMLTPEREFWRLLFLDSLLPYSMYSPALIKATQPCRVDAIKGACLLLRSAALDVVGQLDEGYPMYTEEVDLCHRLALAGWELWFLPNARVTHFGEASSRQVRAEMFLQLYRSKVRFFRKFGGQRRATRFKFYLWFAYLPRVVGAGILGLTRPEFSVRMRTFARLLKEIPTY